jgi:hypothetical protein
MSSKSTVYTARDEQQVLSWLEDFENAGQHVKRTGTLEVTAYAYPQRTAKKRAEEEKAAQRLTKREREENIIPRP